MDLGTACEDCRYYVRISDAVWRGMYANDKLPETALIDKKLNFCAMVGRFLKSAIFACTIKEGKDGQIDLSAFDLKKGDEWTPSGITLS